MMGKRELSISMIFNSVQFGTDIFACRKELGMTGEAVAELIPVDKSALYKYEKGLQDNMKMQNFLAICNLYDLDPRRYFELER